MSTTRRNDDPQILDNQLCFAVYAAAHAFGRAYRAMLSHYDLTYPQYLVLIVLWEEEGLTVKEIGTRLFLDSGTLTPLLKRLEGSGHVRRMRDRVDERQVSIFLTDKGRDLRGKMQCLPVDVGGMTGMSPETRRELLDMLVGLRGELHASSGLGEAAAAPPRRLRPEPLARSGSDVGKPARRLSEAERRSCRRDRPAST